MPISRPVSVSVLPVRTAQATPVAVRLRVVARPEPTLAQLPARLGLELPSDRKSWNGWEM